MEKQVLFTIFGATGDLASRKLYPSLFRLFKRGELAENFAVIGTARRPWTDDYYREIVLASISSLSNDKRQAELFTNHFYYQSHDVSDSGHYATLKVLGEKLASQYQTRGNQIFFLAMAPRFFGNIAQHLKSEKVLTGKGFERIVIEKPFGESLSTATELNDSLRQVFDESQIFRIDHYLGKEMIQSVSAVRFANPIFEALWSNQYIDNIQITFAEAIGVEDRGGYYDGSGALKDMIQNHVLQVLSLLAMEKPVKFDGDSILAEKVKALQAIRKYSHEEAKESFIRGQYVSAKFDGQDFIGYRSEPKVAEDSRTETFVAGKFLIDNERWAGVPFYVRSGKRLTEKGTRINVVFKNESNPLFENVQQNVLTIYIQPTEGFSLTVNGKQAGSGFEIDPLRLAFRHDAEYFGNSPEAYETLFLDALNGNSMNFSHWEEAKRAWELIDVVREAWDSDSSELPEYPAGSMGPIASFKLLEKDGRSWNWKPDEWYRKRGKL
ncbi:glucose-6-phosphate dehydrogenase [Lactovum miscens]|uniref:Glucose-6-phosphate 1-dehydrogenase n=1 Tax=Lactovum miscens TaxID=190387 RepID=A0A841C9B4_9LACT|nr:glucose-6-phosphate dehydrogenase [Lactovum miscens]MBB5887800.1 glucose-6-phosphate 1-dehydrogenase [Lactovum miscens]